MKFADHVIAAHDVIPPHHVIPALSRNPVSFGALLIFASVAAFAQQPVTGVWRSIDDNTGEAKAEIRITETGGKLTGRIEKLLRKDAKQDTVCDKCEGDRKDKPMIGLEIIRGDRILDPENGREYRLRLTPIEDGKKLEVRGYLGPFYRNQVWVRAQ